MEEQLETGTHPCADLEDLAREIREGRVRANKAAEQRDARIVALGTSLFPSHRRRSAGSATSRRARPSASRPASSSRVAAMSTSRSRPTPRASRSWTGSGRGSPLLALSANSPYWQGEDSGYASFRSQVWSRWPTAGPAPRSARPRRTAPRSTRSWARGRSSTPR
ncbi:glutamate-cysteine ligase family protein [Oerskovia sp. M15]